MQNTIKLYDTDSYLNEFSATVLSCEAVSSDKYAVILDRTCFFPTEGGQDCDSGMLNDHNVNEVSISDGVITHYTSEPLTILSTVQGKINFKERFSKMQQHSGEHILSGLIFSIFGYDNVGFHLGGTIVTMDFNGLFTEENIALLEEKANEAVYKNLPIRCFYPKADELSILQYRSKKKIESAIRLVQIEGVDLCACCAPHVKSTGEIGIIKIIQNEHFRGGTRLTILCGERALTDYDKKQKLQSSLSVLLSSKPELIYQNVVKQLDEVSSLRMRLLKLQCDELLLRAKSIPAAQRNVCLFTMEYDTNIVRNVVNELSKEHSGYCAVFNLSKDSTGYIIKSEVNDCRLINQALKEHFNAKGGGSALMVQGSLIGSEEEISSFFSSYNASDKNSTFNIS